MGDAYPARLGRYQVVKHLATGGMAEVLLARHDQTHVVIKRVRPEQAGDDRFVRMFIDEARLAGSLVHPNIVRVFEIGEDASEHFFAMEYVHGEDLRRVLMEVHGRRDKVPIALVTGIVAAAAAGLHYAHTRVGPNGEPLHIVHRDVSPANILVGYDGAVKVADFGIAKAALRTVETRSGTLKGKVSYMSPEQVTGKPVDCRSDVFALGIVLYELATARRLFKGDNDFLTMSAIVQGNIPMPSTLRPDLPRILEDIIMKALSPAAADRYATANDLRLALEKFTHAIGMTMSPRNVADYMSKLFGSRAEPWMVLEELTQTTTIDFDGSASGLVQPPPGAVHAGTLPSVGSAPSSPIVLAKVDLTGIAPTPQEMIDATPEPVTGSLAWMNESPPTKISRRRLGIGAGIVATLGIGGIVAMQVVKSDEHDPETVKMTASPAPAVPGSEPGPAPSPPPPAVTKPEAKPAATKLATKPPKVEPAAEAKKPEPRVIAKSEPLAKAETKKPATKKPAMKKKPPQNGKDEEWDPNTLFPK